MSQAQLSYLDRFVAAARRHRDRPAVLEADRVVTYEEFLGLSRRIALALAEGGGLPRVLIHLPQTTAAYASMFAVGLAGGFYTTTNTAAPAARRRGTFAAFRPQTVITDVELAAEARALCPEARIVEIEALGNAELTESRPPHALAYVMFTSGSSGQPKGVMIGRAALGHYVDWALDAMRVVPEDRWSQHPNIAFDLSVLDIYGALCAGAALVPITGADALLPGQAIRRHQLTIWNSVPSIITSMIKIRQASARNFESLRLLTFCGEALLPMHVEAIFAARRDLVVHNTYGPTEATVACTLLRLDSETWPDACQATVAIGDPIADMAIDLVGGAHGEEGEIVITGPQLAEGYWNDPAATARQFRVFRHQGQERRGYFTGDWATRDGRHVFFRSRIDTQVKIRGERVELDDIAAALVRCGRGFAAALLVGETLHGVFESAEPLPPPEQLRAQLAELLPAHLVPQHFHAMRELPRNANGKVDLGAIRHRLESRALPDGT